MRGFNVNNDSSSPADNLLTELQRELANMKKEEKQPFMSAVKNRTKTGEVFDDTMRIAPIFEKGEIVYYIALQSSKKIPYEDLAKSPANIIVSASTIAEYTKATITFIKYIARTILNMD